MASSCGPPKTAGVRSYTRAKRKKKAKGPTAYYVAENQHGEHCAHKHTTRSGALACARSTQRHFRNKYGSKSKMAGTWLPAKRTS